MTLDEEFLAKVRDSRYSCEWVGIALRWRLDAAPQASTGNGNHAGVPGPADAAPMESAPTDGTPILAFVPAKKAWLVVHWRKGWGHWFTVPGEYGCVPSCWMRLPALL